MSQTFPASEDTLHLPRILCLHGGGTNSNVLSMQARAFIPRLAPFFRLIFAEAPFCADPHPAIIPVYQDFGPFKIWSRWLNTQPVNGGDRETEGQTVVQEAEYQCRSAMEADDALGATGEWLGLLGFSQGARMAGSILIDQQLRLEEKLGVVIQGKEQVRLTGAAMPEGFAGGRWRFAVLMAGRGPFIALSPLGEKVPWLELPGVLSTLSIIRPDPPVTQPKKLVFPTLHVHGMTDNGLPFHRQLLELDCEADSTTLIEWDGDHRLPYKSKDVDPVVQGILKVAKQAGALRV